MKGFLFLSLVGAALYGALLVSNDLLPRDRAEDPFARENLGNPDSRQLRSWGSDLPALVSSSSQRGSLPLRKPDVAPSSFESSQYPTSSAGEVPPSQAKSTSAQHGDNAYVPSEWAKVAFAARVHSEASISSPVVRFYPGGRTLQVVDRENGWVQIFDPTSGEGGWVFEQYLVPTDGSQNVTQAALETNTSKALTDPVRTNPMPSAKKRVRAPRPTARIPESVAVAQFDRRWERRAERRGGFGLLFFGRFARAE